MLDDIRAGATARVDAHLKAGADPNGTDPNGIGPLIAALSSDRWEIARMLLEKGAQPGARDSAGDTALMLAAEAGRPDLVSALLKAGAKPDPDVLRESPLIRAVKGGHEEVVERLLEAGATVDASVADLAESRGHKGMASRIRQRVKEIAAKEKALRLQAQLDEAQKRRERLERALLFGRTIAVREALSEGGTVDSADKIGITPLIVAASGGDPLYTDLLLEHGANVDQLSDLSLADYTYARDISRGRMQLGQRQGSFLPIVKIRASSRLLEYESSYGIKRIALGTTPLFQATAGGYADVLKILLAHGADPDKANHAGETPLMYAAYFGRSEIAGMLLDAGADPDARAEGPDLDGSAVSPALGNQLKKDLRSPPLLGAAQAGRLDIARLLLDHGADIEIRSGDGSTALIEAALSGHGDVVVLLLTWDADVDAKTPTGAQAIHAAANAKTDAATIRALLKAGADPQAVGPQGLTPLQLASLTGATDVVATLVEADVSLGPTDYRSPVVMAADNGNPGVLRVLLEAGAEIPDLPSPKVKRSDSIAGMLVAASRHGPSSKEFIDAAKRAFADGRHASSISKELSATTDSITSGLFSGRELAELHFQRAQILNFYKVTSLREIDDLNEAVRLDPGNYRYFLRRGTYYASREGTDYELAESDLRRALSLSPSDPKAKAAILSRLGLTLHLAGRTKDAIGPLREAIELDPAHADYHLRLARAYSTLGDGAAASQAAQKAAAMFGKKSGSSVRMNLAESHYLAGNFSEAIAIIDQELREWPRSAGTWIERGRYLAASGDHSSAVATFDQAIALKPRNGEPYYLRGQSLEVLGDTGAAIADYRTALRHEPEFDAARLRLDELGSK